jgi:hypothetical protein
VQLLLGLDISVIHGQPILGSFLLWKAKRAEQRQVGVLHSVSALEQAQGCFEATTEPISHVMLLLHQLQELLRPERATRIVGNERPQDSSESKDETKVMTDDIRERLDRIDKDLNLKLETLDYIFSGTKDYAEEFHQLYVQPLLESGLTLEDSLAMLVEGVLRPN